MKRNGEIIRKLLLIVCFFSFIFSIFIILNKKYDEYKEREKFEKLAEEVEELQREYEEEVQLETVEDTNQVEEMDLTEKNLTEKETIIPRYEEKYKENEDLYGWIKIEGTPIDYPVMHTPDEPNYYLYKNYDKEDSKSGTPFVDGRVDSNTNNVIIYAHNMKNGEMFGSLKEYKEKSYFENHRYIKCDTIYEEAKYEIVAVSKAVIYYDKQPAENEYLFYEHINLNSKEEFDAYIKNAKENAYYDTGITAEYGDKLITLCTCDYWTENARLIVVAKKI